MCRLVNNTMINRKVDFEPFQAKIAAGDFGLIFDRACSRSSSVRRFSRNADAARNLKGTCPRSPRRLGAALRRLTPNVGAFGAGRAYSALHRHARANPQTIRMIGDLSFPERC